MGNNVYSTLHIMHMQLQASAAPSLKLMDRFPISDDSRSRGTKSPMEPVELAKLHDQDWLVP